MTHGDSISDSITIAADFLTYLTSTEYQDIWHWHGEVLQLLSKLTLWNRQDNKLPWLNLESREVPHSPRFKNSVLPPLEGGNTHWLLWYPFEDLERELLVSVGYCVGHQGKVQMFIWKGSDYHQIPPTCSGERLVSLITFSTCSPHTTLTLQGVDSYYFYSTDGLETCY